ncbi:stringent starvation protein B [Candidatus Erwinia haradaeae]|uniref:Stringent starvation protein B n=1 Tax=Candidatus Erwinia haradaeae TaxID=1922217 RepID=A0A451D7Y2_9GAMM|nr:ClpXP protease specificity-enhancing factor SspB [Candidatus Erwinia haradaeae]VFP81814.1 Stringent starvation protein B [Candidatus Erwinia haradaeae]
MIESQFTDQRPYLLRAWYQWFIDNKMTPHILVNINFPSVVVPISYASHGKIILNISPKSVENLEIKNDKISFNTCFNGIIHKISLPPTSIQAIYSIENGIGTSFENTTIKIDRTVNQSQENYHLAPIAIESDTTNLDYLKSKNNNNNIDTNKTFSEIKKRSILRIIK